MGLRRVRPVRAALLLLIASAFALRLPAVFVRYIDVDELQHLHAARNIFHGMVPYRDFFEHHTPLFHYLLAPGYFILPDDIRLIFLVRLFMLVGAVAIIVLTYRLARMQYSPGAALYAAVLLSFTVMFHDKALEIRPDSLATILCLSALIFFMKGTRRAHDRPGSALRYLFLSGFCIASAILTTQKAVFGLAAIGIAWAWLAPLPARPARDGWGEAAGSFCAGFAIPVAAVCGYFLLAGGLREFLYRNIVMNLRWQYGFTPFEYLRKLFAQNPVLCIFGAGGLAAATLLTFRRRGDPESPVVPVSAALAFIAGLFLIHVPNRQYYLFIMPLIAVFAGYALNATLGGAFIDVSRIFSARRLTARRRGWIIAAVMVCVIAYPLICLTGEVFTKDLQLKHTNLRQLDEIRYILAHTTPQDTVLDGWTGSGVFRGQASYFGFLPWEVQLMLTKEEMRGVVRALEEKRPKIVIYDMMVKMLPAEAQHYVAANYKRAGFGDLCIRNKE